VHFLCYGKRFGGLATVAGTPSFRPVGFASPTFVGFALIVRVS
jgi:hypothetical protein